MEIDFEIEGALEIEKALNKLELRIEKNISRRAVGAGAKVFIRAMKSLVPSNTGTLKRSIGMKRLKTRKSVTVIIGPRSGKARQERVGRTGKTQAAQERNAERHGPSPIHASGIRLTASGQHQGDGRCLPTGDSTWPLRTLFTAVGRRTPDCLL